MADPRFFSRAGPFSVAELAAIADASLHPGTDPMRQVSDVAALEVAADHDLGFLENRKYLAAFRASRAGVCIISPDAVGQAPAGMGLLLNERPYHAYARVAAAFYPEPAPTPGIDAGARISPTAEIAAGCRIEAGAVIGAEARVGARCRIGANSVVGDGVIIGNDCRIGPGVSLSHCIIGNRVVLHGGVRIGQAGFGFAPDPAGHVKVPQLGRVIVHDEADIGANTTIDRGSGPDTVIGQGCMIDNLVQIGHNVQLGRGCIVVSQAGISGSTRLGDFVVLGGQVGLAGHLTIGSGARIAARGGVSHDLPGGQDYGGVPAVPIRAWRRQVATLARLAKRPRKEDE